MLPLLQHSKGTGSVGYLRTRSGKNLQFSSEIAVYLGDGKTKVRGYYGSLVEVVGS